MSARLRVALYVIFAVTGFSALTLQVVWQRVISLHAGVDLVSITTVVSAFLAGLGLGSLLGGMLADRLGPRRSLFAFAVSNTGIGVFAWVSLWLFYDGYRALASDLESTLASFAFQFALLVVPTTLMGLSLPLVARGVVATIDDAAPLVGRLYGINTLGAGAGAALSGWLLLGSIGFEASVRLAGSLNLLAATSVIVLWRTASRAAAPVDAPAADTAPEPTAPAGAVWPWLVLYGLTGAVALGFEIVFFRVVDAIMRSNSYTFAHVLTLYLVLFGAGTALGSRLVRRAGRPAQWFLWLQGGVGLAALLGVIVLVEAPSIVGVDGSLDRYFSGDGYTTGGYEFASRSDWLHFLFAHFLGPLLVMGLPVLLMGAAFPFAQALVAERVDTLGRRTGQLLFANIVGNVAGTLIAGFVLVEHLGTSGTFRILAGLLVIAGLAAAWTSAAGRRRVLLAGGTVAAFAVGLAAFPTNEELWAFLQAADLDEYSVAEDRACVNSLKDVDGEQVMYVNAASQNAYPYDDFHVLVGLMPALLHPSPERGMALGLGIGGTPYGMAQDPRIDRVDTVEICGQQLPLLEELAATESFETARLLDDPKVDIHVGDGRKFLLTSEERFDVVTVDTLRPQAAFSGNLYSVEFYELLADRMSDDGLLAQWAPTARTMNTVTEVFPHVVVFSVSSYRGSPFFVASRSPIEVDPEALADRLADVPLDEAFRPAQAKALEAFVAAAAPTPVPSRGDSPPLDDDLLNHDLFPRDEYFLNQPQDVERRSVG